MYVGFKHLHLTLSYFLLFLLFAVVIGIVLGLVVQPGDHTSVASDAASAPSSTGSLCLRRKAWWTW